MNLRKTFLDPYIFNFSDIASITEQKNPWYRRINPWSPNWYALEEISFITSNCVQVSNLQYTVTLSDMTGYLDVQFFDQDSFLAIESEILLRDLFPSRREVLNSHRPEVMDFEGVRALRDMYAESEAFRKGMLHPDVSSDQLNRLLTKSQSGTCRMVNSFEYGLFVHSFELHDDDSSTRTNYAPPNKRRILVPK